MGTWNNADGLYIEYGRANKGKPWRPYSVKSFGAQKEVVFEFDLANEVFDAGVTYTADLNNDGTLDGFTLGDFAIPDQAIIDSCDVYMSDEAGAGGTSVAVGTFTLDGTAIDADGLLTATEGAVAALTANTKVAGSSGAQLGAGVTQAAYVAMTVAGTFTAGKGRVVIRYTDVRAA